MRVQKHLAYKYKDKEHYKHVLVLPEKAMETLGWRGGMELDDEVKGGTLVLKPKRDGEEAPPHHELEPVPLGHSSPARSGRSPRSYRSTSVEHPGKVVPRKNRIGR